MSGESRQFYTRSSSQEVRRMQCPGCGSRTGCAEYSDGHWYCHACEKQQRPPSGITHRQKKPSDRQPVDVEEKWRSGRAVLGPRHGYLRRKGGLTGYGLRCRDGKLMVPVRTHDGKLVSLQYIKNSGQKKLAKGCQLGEGYFSYGKNFERIFICEGVADALTVYMLTGDFVVAAMSAGRMPRIAKVLRDTYPKSDIIACADNDSGKKRNVGVEKATEAAATIDAKLVVPPEPGDINDYWQNHDDSSVLELLASAKTVERPMPIIEPGLVGTDVAFADLFVEQHAENAKHVAGDWFVWDGIRWKRDDASAIQELGIETARSILDNAANTPVIAEAQELAKWGRRSLQKNQIKAGIELARSNPRIRRDMAEFDSNPLLLNCGNATVDLRTGEGRTHRRADLITKVTATDFDADAECPIFHAFLASTFAKSKEQIEYMQRVVGYSLSGSTEEQCLFLLHGGGSNGKSVLIETIHDLMGDYSATASVETFMPRRGVIPNDIARLRGARLVTVSETQKGGKLNESLIKDLTGGDTISARFLNREFFDFRPQLKLWIRANHRPTIDGTDEGIWRRIRLVPFDITIARRDQDKQLPEKLRAEFPGIFAWAVRGCSAWLSGGLRPPRAVSKATRRYRNTEDVVGRFLRDRTKRNLGGYVMRQAMYDAFRGWCDAGNERPMKQREFNDEMVRRGEKKGRNNRGNHWKDRSLK